jgi:3-hydroxyisobutyrate dehydrogenase-like beta-hydroxyacid dehydrogenase
MNPPPVSPPCIGLIGLGLLGSAFAARLLAGGFTVLGFDLAPDRREAFARSGGAATTTAQEVFQKCSRLILSLPSHREVEDVIAAGQLAMRTGQIIIDTTTGDPEPTAVLAAELALRGVRYLDATVSGSSAHVRQGVAVMMVGGDPAAFTACADVFSRIGGETFYTGHSGTGSKMKLATNVVLGLNMHQQGIRPRIAKRVHIAVGVQHHQMNMLP